LNFAFDNVLAAARNAGRNSHPAGRDILAGDEKLFGRDLAAI
jgi:hypothetical protein